MFYIGDAIILCNSQFDGDSMERRDGSEVDLMRIHRLLVTLGFDIKVLKNKTAAVSRINRINKLCDNSLSCTIIICIR